MVEWGPCKAVRVLQQKGGAGSANFSCNPAIFQAHKAETSLAISKKTIMENSCARIVERLGFSTYLQESLITWQFQLLVQPTSLPSLAPPSGLL